MLMSATVMKAILFLLALFVTAFAKPLAFTPRDAISPPITDPTAQTVWKAGDKQTVTWDLSGLEGVQPSNPQAKIILGTFTNGQEHLLLDTVLASGFNILDGNVTLTVPSVATGTDYIVCLFGSSGDISPAFTILGTDASISSSSPATDAASSSNTLPPHQTTDPSTTVSLPSSAIQTTDASSTSPLTTVSSQAASASASSTAVLPSSTSSANSGSTQSIASSISPSTSTTATGTASSDSSTTTSGARATIAGSHIWSAILGALIFWVLL